MTENAPEGRPTDALSLSLSTSVNDAEKRADWWEFEDPFPDIKPALLMASHIANYTRVAGIVYPFDHKLLKGATYQVGIAQNAYYWDGEKKRKVLAVEAMRIDGIVLLPNSITFVETDVDFRIPHYIAIRFNLHIKLVHRGLLLGTGPLVDPGFRGKLLIPLHNLTSTPYTIRYGEKIVWIEFTKTAFGEISKKKGYEALPESFQTFPHDKRWLTSDDYFQKANAGNPIMSSIAGFIFDTNKSVKKTERFVKGIGLFALIGLILSVGSALFGSWSVYNNALSILKSDEARRAILEARIQHLELCSNLTPQELKQSAQCKQVKTLAPLPPAAK